MRRDEVVSFGSQAEAAEIVVAVGSGRDITLRAGDIIGVEDLGQDVPPLGVAPLSRIYTGEHEILVRDTRSNILAAIDASAAQGGVVTVTGTSYSVGVSDRYLFVDDDTAGADVTITLPTAVGIAGRPVSVKKLGTTGTVTVDGSGVETIDNALIQDIVLQYDAIEVVSDGTNWWIV